jgi:hypothetical protein
MQPGFLQAVRRVVVGEMGKVAIPGSRFGERRFIDAQARYGEHKRNQHNTHDHPSPRYGHLGVRNLGEI